MSNRVDEIKAERALRDRRIRELWPTRSVREIALDLGMDLRTLRTRARYLGLAYRHADAKPQADAA